MAKKYKIIRMSDPKLSFWQMTKEKLVFGKRMKIKFMRTDYFGFTIYSLIIDGKIHDLKGNSSDTIESVASTYLFENLGIQVPFEEIKFESHLYLNKKSDGVQSLQTV